MSSNSSVLVHGSAARVDDVATSVEKSGLTALRANNLDDVTAVVADCGPGGLGGYIQLPVEISFTPDAGPIEQVHRFLADGLLARIEAARIVVPALAEGAGVVLAAGNAPDAESTPDNRAARRLLLGVLQRAILDEAGPADVGVTVLDVGATPDEVVEALGALAGKPHRAGRGERRCRPGVVLQGLVLGPVEPDGFARLLCRVVRLCFRWGCAPHPSSPGELALARSTRRLAFARRLRPWR